MSRHYPAPLTHERYLSALGDHDPIESMRKAPRRLRKLIKGLSKKTVRRAPEPVGWSIHDVLAHLCDGEMVLGTRMRLVAAMERPSITSYDQDQFVARLKYGDVPTSALLEWFSQLRAMNVALLERLEDADFARVGVHSERGEESLSTMLHMYAGHDRLHEAQIVRLAAAPARSSPGAKRASDRAPEVGEAPDTAAKGSSKRRSKRKHK